MSLAAKSLGDGLGARADVEFFVDAPDVGAHGFKADPKFVGDFLVHETLTQQIKDFLFAGRKFFGWFRGGGGHRFGLEGLNYFPRDVSGHG